MVFAPLEVDGEIVRQFITFNYVKPMAMTKDRGRVAKLGKVRSREERDEQFSREKCAKNQKLFYPSEVKQLLDNCHTPQIRAMILLGLNAGFLPIDCARFPLMALGAEESGWTESTGIDDAEQVVKYGLDSGLITFDRFKKQNLRMVQLWPETQEALRQVMAERFERLSHLVYKWQEWDEASDEERQAKNVKPHGSYWHPIDPVFLTEKLSNSWAGTTEKCSAVSHEFSKIKERCKFNGSKSRIGISAMRQTHRTATDNAHDWIQQATSWGTRFRTSTLSTTSRARALPAFSTFAKSSDNASCWQVPLMLVNGRIRISSKASNRLT